MRTAGENIFYVAILAIGLIILGGKYPKIALSFAGLVLLGSIVLNVDKFKDITNPATFSGSSKAKTSTAIISPTI